MKMSEKLSHDEKIRLSSLFEAVVRTHENAYSKLEGENYYAPILLKENATWSECVYVEDYLIKKRVEWIQGNIFVEFPSDLHEAVNAKLVLAIANAVREQSEELVKVVDVGGGPSLRWEGRGGGNIRVPDGTFRILDHEHRQREFSLIIEVNYKGLSTRKFVEKLEGWINHTTQVMVVIGLDLKRKQPRLDKNASSSSSSSSSPLLMNLYHYVRSADGHVAVSQFRDSNDQPTFRRVTAEMQLSIDLRKMFEHFPGLYERLFRDGNIQPNLVISLADVLSELENEF